MDAAELGMSGRPTIDSIHIHVHLSILSCISCFLKVEEQIRRWKKEMEFYSDKLTLEYHRMFLEYVAEKDAKKVQKLNGMSKPPEGEQTSINRDIDIESTLTDEGEETTSSSSSEGDSDGDNANVQESSREGEDSSSSTVIYEREKDENSEKTKNENESSEDVGEDNGTEEGVEETNQTSENGGETNRKSEDDSSIIGTQSQLVKTLEEVLDVEMKEDTTKEDSKKEDEAAKEEASTDEDGTRQSQLVKVLKELSEVEANKEDTAEEVTKRGNEAAEEVDSVDEISDSDNDFRIKICKRPDTFLKVMKKDLIAEIQKDLLEDLIELDRTKEDDVNTDKFIESIENSLKPKRNDEDVDIFEEKERSSNSTASGIVSQEILVEDKEKGSFSDGSQTLTADSKTLVHESQSLLQSEDTDKKYSKVLEIKKTVLASSSDEDDSSQEDSGEPASETEESESEEESKESDSEMETGKKKTKKTVRNSEKRKRFDSSDGSSDKEEKELNKLTNLNTLKRRKLIFDSTEDEDEEEETDKEKSKATPKNTEKKSKQKSPVETLLDMYADSSSSESEAEKKANEEDEETDPMKFVWKNTLPTIKSLVLATSDSSSDDSLTSEEESKKEEKPKEEPKKEKKKYQKNKKPSWKNDPLLRDELSSEEEQRRWKEKQKKLSSPPVVEIISDSSDADNFRPSATEKKKKRKRHDIKISDVSSSESEVEQHTPVKSQDTPSKGRKNIKKILKKDSLLLETRQALRAETERKKRLAARNKIYNELFAKDDKQLVLDFDPQTKKPLLKVDKTLVAHLKPHQREGVKFMWDCCFESLKRLEEDSGSGCILAHCMGLGKTLQAVTLVHTLLNNDTGVQTVLIVCPLNTVSNWQNEFVIWLKNLNGKKIRVFAVNQFNKHFQRSETLQNWQRDGGVMIISYEMFRRLTGALKQSPHKKHGPVYERTLLDPGPDLVICDEGHKIKNQETALSKNMRKIKTLRRVILTGTPLQNNLKEYYWMVNFVKPNILGSKKEFNNRFINPIHNGQFKDSTVMDVKIMKKRSHVLHSMLDGCIQRINYDIASPYLPEKHEYVIYICLTETQAKLYDYYLHQFSKRGLEKVKSASLFNDFHSLQRVCTHPQVLRNYAKKPNEEEETAPPPKTQTPSIQKFFTPSVTTGSTDEVATNLTNLNGAVLTPAAPLDLLSSSKPQIPVDWWKGMVEEREFEDPYASGKLCLLWSILEYCQKIGDKLLVFSQSLQTLNLIEYFLKKLNESGAETWVENLDYFKLTGSTSLENRTKACKKFNKSDNQRGRLFLISTRAGGLGINLIAANRVIIFDASWNPSHDVQSIFRVYRFGQEKTCYIYRFLAEATMEEKIYDRQITKLSLSDRVVDEHQIERHFTLGNLTELYNYEPIPPDQWETPMVPKDLLLAEILAAHKDIIVRVLEHDSLLENKEEEELTEEERQAAWEEFEKEKFADNRGIASPLANSNSNVQPGASPVAYNGSVLDMLDILKNTTGNTSPGPSVVPNPFANGSSPSRRLPGSAPSSPVTKTPAATPAINFSNETMAQRSEPNGTEQNSLADASPTTPPRNANLADTPPSVSDSAHAGSSKNETQFSNEDALDHVLRMGILLDLPLNEAKTIDVANLFSDYSDDSIRGLFALLLRGLEANQTQNQNQLRIAEIVKPSTSPVKDTPVRTVKTPAEKKETLPLPVPEPMSVPTPEPETKPTASPELPEKMEIDEVEEAEALPAEEEKQKPVEDEDVKVDEPKIPEEKKEEEEVTERKESKEVSDKLVTDEKVEESSEIMRSTSPKDEDMISALEDIFRDDRKKESNKEEGAITNGEPEKSSSKSSGETDGISLKILTQVEKSVLSDLDSEAASQGIEGTCAD